MENGKEGETMELTEENLLYIDQPHIITRTEEFKPMSDSLDEEGII